MRARVAGRCGGRCGQRYQVGDAVLELRVPELANRFYRCEACAGEPAPDLPPLASRPIDRTPLVHIASGPNTLPLDWKSAGAGEREPGADD